MTAEVHIVLGEAHDVLTVPSAALGNASTDGKYTVRVMAADGSTAQRKVEVGLNDKVTAQIRSGLQEGERVITGELTASASSAASRGPGGPPPMGF